MSCRSRFSKGFPLLWSTVSLIALVIGSLLAGCGGGLKTGVVASRNSAVNAGVFLPSSTPFGKSYAEWAIAFHRFYLEKPVSVNPATDPTGER
jgi:hypothetical protein